LGRSQIKMKRKKRKQSTRGPGVVPQNTEMPSLSKRKGPSEQLQDHNLRLKEKRRTRGQWLKNTECRRKKGQEGPNRSGNKRGSCRRNAMKDKRNKGVNESPKSTVTRTGSPPPRRGNVIFGHRLWSGDRYHNILAKRYE